MRALTITSCLLFAGPALAHVGHLGEYAGHDHWVAGAAIGVAAAITLWTALKGKKAKETETAAKDDEPESDDAEEASA